MGNIRGVGWGVLWGLLGVAFGQLQACTLTVDTAPLSNGECPHPTLEKRCEDMGKLRCVPKSSPDWGCGTNVCLSCKAQANVNSNVATTVCNQVTGACQITGCTDPWKDCNQNLTDGCEANTDYGYVPRDGDPKTILHCGKCTLTACPKVDSSLHKDPACVNGACTFVCQGGYRACNTNLGSPSVGCTCPNTSFCGSGVPGCECPSCDGG
jgi:hypothetical protein